MANGNDDNVVIAELINLRNEPVSGVQLTMDATDVDFDGGVTTVTSSQGVGHKSITSVTPRIPTITVSTVAGTEETVDVEFEPQVPTKWGQVTGTGQPIGGLQDIEDMVTLAIATVRWQIYDQTGRGMRLSNYTFTDPNGFIIRDATGYYRWAVM